MLSAETKILATIGDQTITAADLQARLEAMPAQYSSFYATADGKKKLLTQLVQEKLLYLEAKTKKLDKDPEVLTALDKVKSEVMMNYFLKKEMEKVTVSDKDIKDYYDQNKAKYLADASIKASHILVKEEKEADDIVKEINNGGNFEQIAKEKSTCPSGKNGGDLGNFSRGQMVKPFEDAAFALKVGEMTEKPVQTQFGWHIIKVTDKKEAQQKDYAEIKGEIRSSLLYDKQKNKLEELTEAAKKKYSYTVNEGNLSEF